MPTTAALRREEIRLQVALITPLIHVKGYAASEVKAASDRAHVLIEQAQATGEPPEDPLLLFSVLYSFWVANLIAFKGNVCRDFALQFLSLAERQKSPAPLMMGIALWALHCSPQENLWKAYRISTAHTRSTILPSALRLQHGLGPILW